MMSLFNLWSCRVESGRAVSVQLAAIFVLARCLHAERRQAALGGLLHVRLVVLVDDGDSEQDARAGADGAKEVGADGERADAGAAEGGGGAGLLVRART